MTTPDDGSFRQSSASGGPGTIELDYPFPVVVRSSVPPECEPAFEAYETCIRGQWPGERQQRFGYFEFDHGASTLSARRRSGIGRIALRLSDSIDRAAERRMMTTEYSPMMARYFLRESFVQIPTIGTDAVFVSQLTYLRSIQVHLRVRPVVRTYPPSPISNLMIAVIPGRVVGELACTAGQAEFVRNPRKLFNAMFQEALNERVVPVLQKIWEPDGDEFDGQWLPRGTSGSSTSVSLIRDGENSLEPIFSPGLFQCGLFDPETWNMSRDVVRRKPERIKDFCMALTPYKHSTLVILQYPIATKFNNLGNIEQSAFRLDLVASVLEAVASTLSISDATNKFAPGDELDDYNAMVRFRHGLRVPPMEAAIRAAEEPTSPGSAESSTEGS